MPTPDPILETDLAGLRLASPVILGAGTAGTLDEIADVLDLSRLGAVVTKSITPEPREGNPAWRVAPDRAGMLNAIGLANPGIDGFMRREAPRVAGVPTTVIGSIAGFSIADYARVARAMGSIESMPAIELNVSCPNVHGGVEFGSDPAALGELVAAVRAEPVRAKLIVKLSPIAVGAPSIVEVAQAAIDAGADALTICNTIPAMAIDVRTGEPALGNATGGLSGPALHPVAVKLVHDVHRGVAREAGTPIIGLGGVLTWRDAAEFVLAGASAVAIGTGLFVDPRAPLKVARGLRGWVRRRGVDSVRALVGSMRAP